MLLDVVTDGEDHKTSAGRLVGVFEGFFYPKENVPIRKSRDESIQKSIDNNAFSAQSIPDCLVFHVYPGMCGENKKTEKMVVRTPSNINCSYNVYMQRCLPNMGMLSFKSSLEYKKYKDRHYPEPE